MRRFHFIAILVLTAFVAANTAFPQQPSPPLAQLKAAAEGGDPQAQDKLGDVFYLHQFDPEHAVIWYRKAAASGITNSQYQVAHILVGWARSPMAKKEASAMHADEAIPLFIKAANQGVKPAQVELGQVYEEGRLNPAGFPAITRCVSINQDAVTIAVEGISASIYPGNILHQP